MHQELSSGLVQSDLTIQYGHNENGVTAGFKKKDAQVFVGEIIATFLLCFLIAATKVNIGNGERNLLNIVHIRTMNDLECAAGSTIVAIGLGLVSIIYTFAPISGAQLNPSVTLGLYLRGKMNLFEAVYSIIAECIGGLLAGAL